MKLYPIIKYNMKHVRLSPIVIVPKKLVLRKTSDYKEGF